METLEASVRKTGALVTVEEGQVTCGVGAEIAALVSERVGLTPCARVGAVRAPVSSNPVFEAACIPDAAQVVAAVHALLRPSRS
jgi:pyruvate/2-oxoglutarate/acetoin dehydrogenase E1 component